MVDLTPVPGATARYDDDGNEIVLVATCGHCGRSWNDAATSSLTPTPSGRCPFEYEHEYPAADRTEKLREAARDRWASDELEITDSAQVSWADSGAWVEAWVWVACDTEEVAS